MNEGELIFFNGYGGFDKKTNEYVIYSGNPTPLPWINCISCISGRPFGFIISESGGGCVWQGNSRENRLTPWYCQSIRDPAGESIVLHNAETGAVYGAVPGGFLQSFTRPDTVQPAYETRHGFGYTSFTWEADRMAVALTVFVPRDEPVKLSVLTIRNTGGQPLRLDLEYMVVVAAGKLAGVRLSRKEHVFMASSLEPADKTAADSGNSCGVMRCSAGVHVKPGNEASVVFMLGYGETEQAWQQIADQYRNPFTALSELRQVRESWNRLLSAVTVNTPDEALNRMMNGWLLYQVKSCRIDGRTAFYQSGGAFGFRDQLQDVMALIYCDPQAVRRQILLHASRQFEEGDVQHWWHPPQGAGIRSRYSDDLLWLPFVTWQYIQRTGDRGILSEQVPFLHSALLQPGEKDRYEIPTATEHTDTLYAHCCLAVRAGSRLGEHGLPLIRGGDWNDGMNTVGIQERGESVWLGWFLCTVLDAMCAMSKLTDHPESEETRASWERMAAEITQAIETHAWDGGWYIRAYCDNGRQLGSASSAQCAIDSLAQSWSVISGRGSAERTERALSAAEHYLVDYDHDIIKLLTPPFCRERNGNTEDDPGYISAYPPGIRENGAQYTHAAVWLAKAMLLSGRNDTGYRLLCAINPVNHGRTSGEINRYKTEPYVVAADVYSDQGNMGRGGWSWYTGSASWLYMTILEDLLGFRIRKGRLCMTPRLPSSWQNFSLQYRYGNTTYQITVRSVRREKEAPEAPKIPVSKEILLKDDGNVHQVTIDIPVIS